VLELALQQLVTVRSQLALVADEAVERLACDAQLRIKIAYLGVVLDDGRLRQAQHSRCHVRPRARAEGSPAFLLSPRCRIFMSQ
jgi:hypothetical protein